MEAYKAKRLKEVSPRTLNLEVGLVKTMLNRGLQLGLVPANPIASVRKIEGPSRKPIQFLTEEQVVALLANSTPTYRPIFYTHSNTGMRREESVNLEWSI